MKKSTIIKMSPFVLLFGLLSAQSVSPKAYSLPNPNNWRSKTLSITASDSPAVDLKSNVISEIRLMGEQNIWLGTGRGLARMVDSVNVYAVDTMQLTTSETVLFNWGVSAIAVGGNSVLVAGATSDGETPVGAGLYYVADASQNPMNWTEYAQPVDQKADSLAPFANRFFRALPVTTDHANITYDASIGGGYLWVASWAGGLRRFDLASGDSWDRVPLPLDGQDTLYTCNPEHYTTNNSGQEVLNSFYLNPRDPGDGGNHNHKAFSVLAYSDTVWVGTANGLNRGILGTEGCIDWDHYSFPTDGLSGNWVVGIARQMVNGQRVIWAVTLNADDPNETRGYSYTLNDGATWHSTLLGKRGYNVATSDSVILASTESGLWRSNDGENWAQYQPALDATPLMSEEILSDVVYAAVLDTRSYYINPRIWIGTQDGLARSSGIDAEAWKIFRAEYDTNEVYVYPNPFSPYEHLQVGGDGFVRIHTDVQNSNTIDMNIYNFALDEVYATHYDRQAGSGALKWNGRDQNGFVVANGVYFIRLSYDNKTKWLKLIVVK